ncbi:ribonuclease R [Chitinophaga sp. Mgbs1]|uniref:Ribonuclease R n=1 Tax=Chitinophaga solisilvae TaxID=1233460 RepID=A0A433WAZ8_9BACT|nr:ribonuclease R [Chitinophaga solisilvae]
MSKKKKDKKSPGQKKTFRGVVELTKSGMAFVIVPGLTKDIMVKQKNLHTALDKDEVLVDVIKHARGEGRQEGIITDILKRNKTEFTGTLQISKSFGFLLTEKGMFMPDIYIPANSLKDAKNGDKAVVKIVAWGEKSRKPVGEVIEILDASDTNDLAMKEILIEAGFPLSFPDEVLEELAVIREEITETEVRKRKDVRNILTFTIDPVDAKDFDDAISFRLLKNGLYEIGVHIADVSHYVIPGTELDKEADKRATSVYLPDRVLPMLPEKISNELCSLRPKEDKLTFSAIFQMNEKGEVKHHWIGRTLIHSDHRFTYEDAQEIIEGNSNGPHKEEILLLNKIAQQLRQERFKHGAINFSSQEVRFKLDENGKPIGIVIKESKEAHQLIEEFMLLANRTIAAYVAKIRVNKQPVPFPYRVHDTPDEEKLKVFASFAGKFGYKFDTSSPENIARSFNKMLQLVQGKPEQHVLETLGIRTMAKAIYTTENVGHYGLGFEDYCHFTSPIRRYPDVLVHRVLAECLAGNIHPDKHMEKKCKHDSEMERKAMEAERAANKYKQVEYMQQYIGHTFEGVISGVAHFGFWVETVDTKCEGLVSIHNLNRKEEFVFNEAEYALVGQASGRKFRIGEKVNIRVVAANLAKRQLDYDLESELGVAGRDSKPFAQPGRRDDQRRDDRRDRDRDHRRDDRGRKKKKGKHGGNYIPQKQWQRDDKPAALPVTVQVPPEVAPDPVVDKVNAETHVVNETAAAIPAEKAPVVTSPAKSSPAKSSSGKEKVNSEKAGVKKAAEKKEVKEAPVKTAAAKKVKEKAAKVVKAPEKEPEAVKEKVVKNATGKAPATKKAVAEKETPVKKAVVKKAVPEKTAAAKTTQKKEAAAKTAKQETPKKTAPAKAAAKKATAEKETVKTAAPKKAAASKPSAVKATAPKKAAAKTVAPKKAAAGKAVKAPAKKAAATKKAAAKGKKKE